MLAKLSMIAFGCLLLIFGLDEIFLNAQSIIPVVEVPHLSLGNTAWMLVATALVMLMTIPGLAFFYGGLVRQKNILSILMQCFIILAVISIEWMAFGYSNAFGSSSGFTKGIIGNFDWACLKNIKINDLSPYFNEYVSNELIPHIVFIIYQCMFAVITPALIIGAFAERIKFKGFLIFSVLWAILVYNPVVHWIWSADGWLYKLGVIRFCRRNCCPYQCWYISPFNGNTGRSPEILRIASYTTS